MRSKFDSQDFVQATWASVFHHASRLADFEEPRQFAAFIAGVASNKVKMEIRRRFGTGKSDITRERPLDEDVFHSPDPTASQVAVARETWFRMLKDQPEHHRRMIKMRFSGNSIRQIADHLDLHEGTVQRALRNCAWPRLNERRYTQAVGRFHHDPA
jgi:RNA polymerase sigma factor (sigma-70 family)